MVPDFILICPDFLLPSDPEGVNYALVILLIFQFHAVRILKDAPSVQPVPNYKYSGRHPISNVFRTAITVPSIKWAFMILLATPLVPDLMILRLAYGSIKPARISFGVVVSLFR
jgi:hypothetical protein